MPKQTRVFCSVAERPFCADGASLKYKLQKNIFSYKLCILPNFAFFVCDLMREVLWWGGARREEYWTDSRLVDQEFSFLTSTKLTSKTLISIIVVD